MIFFILIFLNPREIISRMLLFESNYPIIKNSPNEYITRLCERSNEPYRVLPSHNLKTFCFHFQYLSAHEIGRGGILRMLDFGEK